MKLNHMTILKRAWRILWSYRALWIFGIILALTTGGGGGSSGSGGSGYRFDTPPDIQREFGDMGEGLGKLFEQIFTEGVVPPGIIALGVGLSCLVLILIVASIIARFVAENALIKLVDDNEETGEQHSVKEGIRIGWSRAAFRQWLIGLIITLPIVIAVIVAIGLSLVPLLAWTTGNTTVGIFSTVATIGFFFMVLLVAIMIGTIAGLIQKLAFRAAALQGLGVFPSIHRGLHLLRQNLKDVGLMWLIMFGIRLGFTVLLIPLVLLTLIIAAVAGGLLALGVGGIAGLLFSGAARWIVAGIIGGGVFILLMVIPLTFVGGLFEVYKSSVWTLTYRELTVSEVLTTVEPQATAETAGTTDDAESTEA